VAAAHPLAGKPSVTLDQLHEHVELTVQDSSDQGDDRHMFGGERVFYLSDFSAKKRALAMGVGFGWMPTYLVESELRAGELREVQYSGGSRYRFNPMLVHRADRPLGRTGQHLVSLLRRYSLANAKTRAPGSRVATHPDEAGRSERNASSQHREELRQPRRGRWLIFAAPAEVDRKKQPKLSKRGQDGLGGFA